MCRNACWSDSLGKLASGLVFVGGLGAKYWGCPWGLSGRWGLSPWSDGESSLIPLSLGVGDHRGEPDTESLPVRIALRKSLSSWLAVCSTCRVESLVLAFIGGWNAQKWWVALSLTVFSGLKQVHSHARFLLRLARYDGYHGSLLPHTGDCRHLDQTAIQASLRCHFDQTASRVARHHHIPGMTFWDTHNVLPITLWAQHWTLQTISNFHSCMNAAVYQKLHIFFRFNRRWWIKFWNLVDFQFSLTVELCSTDSSSTNLQPSNRGRVPFALFTWSG